MTTLETIRTLLDDLETLDAPFGSLDQDHWSRSREEDGDADLGPVKLQGEVHVELHMTRGALAPLDLAALAAGEVETDDESPDAWATALLTGTASAGFARQVEAGRAGVTFGGEAGGRAAWAHHRPFAAADNALTTLRGLGRDLTNPFDPVAVRDLSTEDLLEIELAGAARLSAAASLTYGLTREILGGSASSLGLSKGLSVEAGAEVTLSLAAAVTGSLRVVVFRLASGKVRLVLDKRRGDFVGVGFELGVDLDITDEEHLDEYVDAFLTRALRLPDRLVAGVRSLDETLEGFADRLEALGEEAKEALAEVTNRPAEELGLGDLRDLDADGRLEALPGDLVGSAREALALFDTVETELGEIVDDALDLLREPLAEARQALTGWLGRYDELRVRAAETIRDHVLRGVHVDFEAGINRTRAREALLDLELDLSDPEGLTVAAYGKALRGDFAPALALAAAPADPTVVVRAGTLRETVLRKRFAHLKLNVFGFELERRLDSFTEVLTSQDVVTGTLTLVGRARAELWAKRGEQIRAMTFTFDLASGVHGFTARLHRSARLEGRAAKRAIPRHVRGVGALLGLDPAIVDELTARLLAAEGEYAYDLHLGLPAAAVEATFLTHLSAAEAETRIFDQLKKALSHLDCVIPLGSGPVPLSELLTTGVWEEVQATALLVPDEVHFPVVGGVRLQGGEAQMAFNLLRDCRAFVNGFLEARRGLDSNQPVETVLGALRRMAALTVQPVGAVSTVPVDAKYLTLALLAPASEIRVTFRRDAVSVTL